MIDEMIAKWVLDPFAWLIAGVVFGLIEIVLPTYFFLGMGLAGAEMAIVVWLFGGTLMETGYPFAVSLVLLALFTAVNWFVIKTFLPYRNRDGDQSRDINDY